MNEAPIKPSDVMLDSDRRIGEMADSIIREINPALRSELQKGGGRNAKIYIILSSASRDLVRSRPDVAQAVLAAYRDTSEWVIYRASEYQWEFYVADSPAGRHTAEAMSLASAAHA